jgi:hypothetical protein
MNPETLKWIEERKPDLVKAAESYLDSPDGRIYLPQEREPKRPRVAGSQLRNLLSAAQSGSSLSVLINLLRYQIGRDSRGWGRGEQISGDALIQVLSREVSGRSGEVDAAERHAVESRLAALLLGYLIREFTYRCKINGTTP